MVGNYNVHRRPIVIQNKRQNQSNKARVQGHVVVLNKNLKQIRHKNLLSKREIKRKPQIYSKNDQKEAQEALKKIEPVGNNLTELLDNIGIHPTRFITLFSI